MHAPFPLPRLTPRVQERAIRWGEYVARLGSEFRKEVVRRDVVGGW